MATTQMCGRNGWHDLCMGLVLDGTRCDCACHRVKVQVTMSGDALRGMSWNASVRPMSEVLDIRRPPLTSALTPSPCVTCGGQGTVGDGGYVECPACHPATEGGQP